MRHCVLQAGPGYCQGMNYLGGLLLYLDPHEPRAFEIYLALIQKRLSELYAGGFERLKAYFYVLDNLLNLFCADLAADFKAKKIHSTLYSFSWFITLFTAALQSTKKSYFVMYVTDLFIAKDFKECNSIAILSQFFFLTIKAH